MKKKNLIKRGGEEEEDPYLCLLQETGVDDKILKKQLPGNFQMPGRLTAEEELGNNKEKKLNSDALTNNGRQKTERGIMRLYPGGGQMRHVGDI